MTVNGLYIKEMSKEKFMHSFSEIDLGCVFLRRFLMKGFYQVTNIDKNKYVSYVNDEIKKRKITGKGNQLRNQVERVK